MKKIRLLLVDDDEDYRGLIKDLLNESELIFDVEETDSSKGAFEKIKRNEYDCILMDYIIPGLSGLEVLKETRKISKSLPFIMVTGYGDQELGEELIQLGASDYISKDELSLKNLQYKINAVVSERLLDAGDQEKLRVKDGKIENYMNCPPLWIKSDSTIKEVINSLNSHHVSSLLIKESEEYVGIVTKRDLIRKVIAQELPRETTMVSVVMTKHILSLDKETSVEEAYRFMKDDHHIRHLAVTENDKIIGVLSVKDLVSD